MKFLVVDDSNISRKKIKDMISELGYEVIGEACDGLDAIEKAKELSPTYITMDLEMPNMKGDEAAKKILEIHKDINIILITSIINQQEIINALKIGAKKFLQKPIHSKKLKSVIEEIRRR
jgi:two-component system chemotaxis response regulator CheY